MADKEKQSATNVQEKVSVLMVLRQWLYDLIRIGGSILICLCIFATYIVYK